MPKNTKRKRHAFGFEEQWLRDFALFYGTGGVTRFSESDLNGVSLTKVLEALARPESIRCEKCDGPGTECVIEALVGDDEDVRVMVRFVAHEVKVEIIKAERSEESGRDPSHAA